MFDLDRLPGAFGADRVYVADDSTLEDYEGEAYAAAMGQVIAEVNPKIVLLGQTSMGRDLAPRLAFRLKTALSMDCVELGIDPETQQLLQVRPVYGGNVRAVFVADRATGGRTADPVDEPGGVLEPFGKEGPGHPAMGLSRCAAS